jgi:hypothetical protein
MIKVNIKNLFSGVCIVFGAIIILNSCTKPLDADPNPQDSYRYFPIEVGDFKLYQKVTYSYAVGQKEKIDSVLVRETVKSKTLSNSDIYYVIEREAKGKNDLFFKAEAVYQVITNPKQVVVGERNIYKILLHYPIYEGATWNINEINGDDEQEVEVIKNDNSLPKKLITDKNIIKVLGDSTNNAITFLVNQNLFAKDIGLIFKEQTYIEYCQDDNCIGKGIIESGKREFWTLLEAGKNK